MKKIFLKLLFWILLLIILISLIFIGLGYLKYKDAINKTSIYNRIKEIQNQKNYTKLNKINNDYKNAVISIEDHRFYNHNGIDVFSIFHSTYVNIKRKSIDYGASTITQQVSRLLYFSQEKSFVRKIAEIFITTNLEKKYSKDEILELYLNLIYYGNGYYGIHDAAKGFFNKDPKDLTLYEASYLAGLPNAPSIYSQDKKLGEERRLQVIDAMKKYGYIE